MMLAGLLQFTFLLPCLLQNFSQALFPFFSYFCPGRIKMIDKVNRFGLLEIQIKVKPEFIKEIP